MIKSFQLQISVLYNTRFWNHTVNVIQRGVIIETTFWPSILCPSSSVIWFDKRIPDCVIFVHVIWHFLFVLSGSEYMNFITWSRDWTYNHKIRVINQHMYLLCHCSKKISIVYFWNISNLMSNGFDIWLSF